LIIQIAYTDDLYVNRLKIKSIPRERRDVDIFFVINKEWYGLSGEWCGYFTRRDRTLSGVI
jgi:hypothetical protein